MRIEAQFWGVTARLAGCDKRHLRLRAQASVADAIAALTADPALGADLPRCDYAIGADIVAPNHPLHDGDALSVLPPVSGG
ncbi:MAG: ThiS family protein [Hydrocarboniphaga sp.]|uniref:MoaD/ThiS family protein n=1 Tax=Hydrocarboniphaga sp. TaxID=2033016 RepID=UPI00261601FF|nr:MoaD/ThiS family protein [Hydrocarboniphaga sp.]MDB5970132.1 ThiS family protein [Hydrocarboniphaga sp.]